jgi:hypothetical protein
MGRPVCYLVHRHVFVFAIHFNSITHNSLKDTEEKIQKIKVLFGIFNLIYDQTQNQIFIK